MTVGGVPKALRRLARPAALRRLLRRPAKVTGRARRSNAAAAGALPDRAWRPAAVEAPDREALLRALNRGRALDQAVVAQVRALVQAGAHDEARSLAESLRRDPRTRELGRLAGGIVAYRQGYVELAHHELREVPPEQRAALAAAEYVRAGLATAPEETLEQIRELVAADPPQIGPKSWFDILGPVYGYGASEAARAVFAVFDRHADDAPNWRAQRDWMRPWVAADPDSRTVPRTRTTFAVMDYGHPGPNRASANIGDHIQSVAALGHLVRHRGVRLHGRDELTRLLDRLGERTRPERALDNTAADLDVITVHRDASMYQEIPDGTWVLCFGWYMHALFGIRHGFPLHDGLRPIFVSFHCNKRALLTPEAIEYLKRYGPVGCRDWTTVYLLLSVDVPAFFSGCLSTTIDTVFPDAPRPDGNAPVGYVDAEPEPGGVSYEHSSEAVRRRPFVANVEQAIELLDTYRSRHRRIVTSRLHCYLPVRSLGIDAVFRPANRSDVRFDGLIDLGDAAFAAMRDGINAKLEPVFTAILEGRPEQDVYGLWRELNAADVATAEQRRRQTHPFPAVPPAIHQRARQVAAQTRTRPASGPAAHAAVLLPEDGRRALAALIASLLEHASRPVHVWVLALPGSKRRALPARFPQAGFSWVPVRRLGARLRTPANEPPPPEQVARLMLPELLPEVDRITLLPLPAVATADIAELADLDLGDHALAAPTRPAAVSGFELIHAAAKRLEDRADAAAALRRTAHARHRFDFDAFTHDVLVLDLARLRKQRLSSQALPLIEAFGLDDLEALHYLVGPNRAAVPERWAAAPTRTHRRDPGLLYWPDRVKPWQTELTPERDRWRHYDALARNTGR